MKTQSTKPATTALTLIELLVVIAVILVLVRLLLLSLSGGTPPWRIKCMNNLKQIGLANLEWAEEHGEKFPPQISVTNGGTLEYVPSGIAFIHFKAISNIVRDPSVLVCPSDKFRTNAESYDSLNNANLSYFIGVDALTNSPTMIISGDRNLTLDGQNLRRGKAEITSGSKVGWNQSIQSIHNKSTRVLGGNLLFTDGHVDWTTLSSVNKTFHNTGLATNRLVLP
jgi:prepilin-type processing-associated H-X9-DG protein